MAARCFVLSGQGVQKSVIERVTVQSCRTLESSDCIGCP